jgi:hypothetical protein
VASPQALFGWSGPGPLSYAALWSLGVNGLLLVALSLVLTSSASDRRQARLFMSDSDELGDDTGDDFNLSSLRAGQLRALLSPLIDETRFRSLWRDIESRYQQRILPGDRLPVFALQQAEAALAGVIGADLRQSRHQ